MLIEGVELKVIYGSGTAPVARAKTQVGYVENAVEAGYRLIFWGRSGGERFETDVWRGVLVGIYFLKLDRQLRSQRELLLVCRHVSS